MARKKRARKKTKRRVSKRRVSSIFKGSKLKKRIAVVINNLLLFVALSLVSFVLYRYLPIFGLQNDILNNLFFIMTMVFGFVAVGFLVVLLILLIIKIISKKR